jgi:hypothetical protein
MMYPLNTKNCGLYIPIFHAHISMAAGDASEELPVAGVRHPESMGI